IVIVAVAVVLAVGLVVLLLVGHEIVEREAVMSRDEVHRGPWLATALVEEIGGGSDAGSQFGQLAVLALPVGADRIAIFVVPLGPAGRETADLVAAGAAIPRL